MEYEILLGINRFKEFKSILIEVDESDKKRVKILYHYF